MRKVLLSRISFSALMLTFLTFIFLFFNFTSAGNWDKPLSGGGSFVYVNETQTNSSVYWGDLLSVHSTQFNKLAGILSLNTNWLENFIINVDKWDNYYTKTQSNNRYLQSESDPNYFNNPNQYYNSTTIPQSYNLAAYYNRTEIDNILLNYYNDSEVDVLINDLNISFGNYYNKTEVDSLINGIPTPDLTIFYNKTEVDNLLNDYYPLSNPYGYLNESYDDSWINNTFYNQTQVDNLINGIDLSIYYTKTESDNTFVKLSNLVSLVGNWTLDKIGYYTKVEIDNKGYLQSESDPTYYSNPNAYYNSTTLPNIDLSPYWKRDGTLTATGNWDLGTYNISANSFIGNGSQLTGLSEKPFAQQGRLSLPQLAGGAYLIEEVPGWAFTGQTNSIQAVSAWLVPIYVSRDVSYRGFRYSISSTTGKTADAYRLGIYDVDYSTGLPKNLVWDSSKQTFATTTGVKQVIGLNIALTEGWYYIVGTKNGNINLYGSSPAQQRPPLGGFGDPATITILTSTTADWTDGFPNPWVNTGFSHMNTNGYEASFFKLYRNSEA